MATVSQEHAGAGVPVSMHIAAMGGFHGEQIQPQVIQIAAKDSMQVQEVQLPQGIIQLSAVSMQEAEIALEPDKQAIYRHPLFPLMALLFEKCEQATQTPDCPTADSFDVDIQAFVHQQEQERKPFFSDEPELDNLMVKAIQVLRIHLLELEKVNELCKDFCTRYISCLKGKLQSEQLLRTENESDDALFDVCTSPPGGDTGQQIQTPQVVSNSGAQQASLSQGQIISGGTVYQMVQTPQGLVAQPIQIQTVPSQVQQQPSVTQASVIHGSTPLSQIGVNSTPSTSTNAAQNLQNAFGVFEDDDDDKKKTKRGILPKHATQVMKSWLFQHIVHPYPTEDEKRQIATQTNLSLLQVNNWFINARRRILQPMLDASNPDQTKVKKNRPQTRPLHRFWPDNIASITPQLNNAVTEQNNNNSSSNNSVDGSQPGTPNPLDLQQQLTAAAQLQSLSNQVTRTQDCSTASQVLLPGTTLMTADGQIISTNNVTVKLEGLSPMLSQASPQTVLLSSGNHSDTGSNQGLESSTESVVGES